MRHLGQISPHPTHAGAYHGKYGDAAIVLPTASQRWDAVARTPPRRPSTAVAPAGEPTGPPHAAASRLRVGTHRTCIARAPRARPAPRRLRSLASPPRAPCVSITTRRAGRRAVWHTQPPGDTHTGGAGLARADTAHSVRLCWPLAPSFPIMNVARRMHNSHLSSQCDARHASLRGTLSTLVRAVFLPTRWHSR